MRILGRWAALALVMVGLTAGSVVSGGVGPALASGPAQASGTVIKIRGIHTIHTHAQADRWLGRTPEVFRDFVVHRTHVVQDAEEQAGASPACVRRTGVVIERYHTAGYAAGGEGGCGGAATLYTDYGRGTRHGGEWRMVKASQEIWFCPVLKRFRVPSALVGPQCYNPARHRVVDYHQR